MITDKICFTGKTEEGSELHRSYYLLADDDDNRSLAIDINDSPL